MAFQPPERRSCQQFNAKQELLDDIYQFLVTFIDEHGYPPSYREIAEQCYVGRTSVPRYLDRLEIQGRITREIGQARSIRVVRED
jgi:SOS-response transcriptional repressor LexA